MNKQEAKRDFVFNYLVYVPRGDEPALAEAWNNYTDSLCKSGHITPKQYSTWTHPRFSSEDWLCALGK